MVNVTIKRAGFDTVIAEVNEGVKISEVLAARNIKFDGMEIRMDGSVVSANETIEDDCELRILKQTTGN